MATIVGGFNLPVPTPELTEVYNLTRVGNQSDQEVLATVADPSDGAHVVITTTGYGQMVYIYSAITSSWSAMTGRVDADKVILRGDITCAGNYTQVGNITKSQTGTATFATDGKTVAEALLEIFSKKLQPTKSNPTVNDPSINPSGIVEAGTVLASIPVGASAFNIGSYLYGPATGVTVASRVLTRTCNPSSLSGDIACNSDGSASDTFGGSGVTIGDAGGTNVASSVQYKMTVNYSDGVVANDNLGGASSPEVKITASSCSNNSSTLTPFRKYFYGATTTVPSTVDSAYIRTLTNSNVACSNGKTFSITIPEGAKSVIIAYPATFRDLTSVKDVGAFGTDIVGSFTKSTVNVSGANNYSPIAYKVYTYSPATALGANTYNVTI